MQNKKMRPWDRVDKELRLKTKDWEWLREKLGIKAIQTLNHWKQRDIPAKYHSDIEKVFQRWPGWIKGEEFDFAAPPGYTEAALDVALLFDQIPVSERLIRAEAFAEIRALIVRLLTSGNSKDQAPPGSEKPSA